MRWFYIRHSLRFYILFCLFIFSPKTTFASQGQNASNKINCGGLFIRNNSNSSTLLTIRNEGKLDDLVSEPILPAAKRLYSKNIIVSSTIDGKGEYPIMTIIIDPNLLSKQNLTIAKSLGVIDSKNNLLILQGRSLVELMNIVEKFKYQKPQGPYAASKDRPFPDDTDWKEKWDLYNKTMAFVRRVSHISKTGGNIISGRKQQRINQLKQLKQTMLINERKKAEIDTSLFTQKNELVSELFEPLYKALLEDLLTPREREMLIQAYKEQLPYETGAMLHTVWWEKETSHLNDQQFIEYVQAYNKSLLKRIRQSPESVYIYEIPSLPSTEKIKLHSGLELSTFIEAPLIPVIEKLIHLGIETDYSNANISNTGGINFRIKGGSLTRPNKNILESIPEAKEDPGSNFNITVFLKPEIEIFNLTAKDVIDKALEIVSYLRPQKITKHDVTLVASRLEPLRKHLTAPAVREIAKKIARWPEIYRERFLKKIEGSINFVKASLAEVELTDVDEIADPEFPNYTYFRSEFEYDFIDPIDEVITSLQVDIRTLTNWRRINGTSEQANRFYHDFIPTEHGRVKIFFNGKWIEYRFEALEKAKVWSILYSIGFTTETLGEFVYETHGNTLMAVDFIPKAAYSESENYANVFDIVRVGVGISELSTILEYAPILAFILGYNPSYNISIQKGLITRMHHSHPRGKIYSWARDDSSPSMGDFLVHKDEDFKTLYIPDKDQWIIYSSKTRKYMDVFTGEIYQKEKK